jgi:hypothetical protein
VHRPPDSEPVLTAAVTDDESKAAAEPDTEAPAPSPEAKPDMAARPRALPRQAVRRKNLANDSHKTPTQDEQAEERVIGLANPGPLP